MQRTEGWREMDRDRVLWARIKEDGTLMELNPRSLFGQVWEDIEDDLTRRI